MGLRTRDLVSSSSASSASSTGGGTGREEAEVDNIVTLSRERSITSAAKSGRKGGSKRGIMVQGSGPGSGPLTPLAEGPSPLAASSSVGFGSVLTPLPPTSARTAPPTRTGTPCSRRGSESSVGGGSIVGVALASSSGSSSYFPASPSLPSSPSHRHHATPAKRKGSVESAYTDSGVSYGHGHGHHHDYNSDSPSSNLTLVQPPPRLSSSSHRPGHIPRSPLASTNFAASTPDLLSPVASSATDRYAYASSAHASPTSSSNTTSMHAIGIGGSSTYPAIGSSSSGHRRTPPPVPTSGKRRKPPAVPIRTINVDAE